MLRPRDIVLAGLEDLMVIGTRRRQYVPLVGRDPDQRHVLHPGAVRVARAETEVREPLRQKVDGPGLSR